MVDFRERQQDVSMPIRNDRQLAEHQALLAQLQAAVSELQALLRSQPDRDTRSPDDLLGYDRFGLP
jgi:hypothetical protein